MKSIVEEASSVVKESTMFLPLINGPIEDGYCFSAYWNHGSFTPIAQKAMVYHELKHSRERWILVYRRISGF